MIPQLLTRLRTEPWALFGAKWTELTNRLTLAEAGGERFTMPRATMFQAETVGPCWGDGEPMVPQLEVIGRVGVIHVTGPLASGVTAMDLYWLGAYDYEWLAALVEQAAGTPGVENIGIIWDSPGGSVCGVEECAARLAGVAATGKNLEHYSKKMIASAAYRLSLGGRLTVSRSAQVGGFGSIMMALDSSGAAKQNGYEMRVFTSDGKGGETPLKATGAPLTPITETQATFLQSITTESAQWFRSALDAARPGIQGNVLLGGWDFGSTAVANGVADEVLDSVEHWVAALAV